MLQHLGSALVIAAAATALAVGASSVDTSPVGASPASVTRHASRGRSSDSVAAGLAGTEADSGPYALPLAGEPAVIHPFVAPSAAWAAGHRGVDLASTVSALVLAPASGMVTFAGTVVDRGVIVVAHPGALRSSLEPVEPLVRAGAQVAAGQVIGTVQPAPGHCAPAVCLHWGVRRGDAYLDPLGLLPGGRPVILLGE